ncbi:MAG: tRNA (adenosine(37)-N6)-threonylcarbamoyltransferase complex dimerization subunit type 1 TsaB [Burkholderiaceae bacterium]
MSKLLTFDTSNEVMHLGLRIDGRDWVLESAGGTKASAELLPAIFSLLESAGAQLCDLDAIGFGCGPGAFTGLRTACAAAQGLALGAGKPVLAIDTLMAIAEDARQGAEHVRVWCTVDARMEQIYAAQYVHEAGRWSVLDAPLLASADQMNRAWLESPPSHVAGNALRAFAGRLDTGSAHCHALAAPRAAALLTVAERLWVHGAALDAGAAAPAYVRDKVAHTIAERATAKELGGSISGPAR